MGMKKMIRTYSELIKLKTFKDRFEYLKLDGIVGEETFGFDRYMNQIFYKSREWTSVRRAVIIRDNGCDLGRVYREYNNGSTYFLIWIRNYRIVAEKV